MSDFQISFTRRKLLHHNPQQCRLPYAVGTYDADSLAPFDIKIHMFKEFSARGAETEGFCQFLPVKNVVAALIFLTKVNFYLAQFRFGPIQPVDMIQSFFSGCGSFRQLLRAPLLKASDQILLPLNLRLLFIVSPHFGFSKGPLLLSKSTVISFITFQFVVLHFKNSICHLIEEISVMGYHDDCALIAL